MRLCQKHGISTAAEIARIFQASVRDNAMGGNRDSPMVCADDFSTSGSCGTSVDSGSWVARMNFGSAKKYTARTFAGPEFLAHLCPHEKVFADRAEDAFAEIQW